MSYTREYGFASNSEEPSYTQSNLAAEEAVSRPCPENITLHYGRAVWTQASNAQDDSKVVCVFEYTLSTSTSAIHGKRKWMLRTEKCYALGSAVFCHLHVVVKCSVGWKCFLHLHVAVKCNLSLLTKRENNLFIDNLFCIVFWRADC